MWNWLRGSRERRKDHRQRFERERDQRIQAELDEGVRSSREAKDRLIGELRRLERAMQVQRDGQ